MNMISFHHPRQTQVEYQDIQEGMEEDVKRKNIAVRLNNSFEVRQKTLCLGFIWPPRGKYLGNVSIE